MSAATASDATTATDATKTNELLIRIQALVITWALVGLVLFGIAWVLGLEAHWWQRVLLALPVVGLAVLDARGVGAVLEVRAAFIRALWDLKGAQPPLAVAGGAWLLGLTASAADRAVLGAVIALVAALYRYFPRVTTPAGGDT